MYPKFFFRPLKMLQWCYIVSMWRERGEGELLLGLPHALTSLHTFPHAVRSATEDCSQDATVTSPRWNHSPPPPRLRTSCLAERREEKKGGGGWEISTSSWLGFSSTNDIDYAKRIRKWTFSERRLTKGNIYLYFNFYYKSKILLMKTLLGTPKAATTDISSCGNEQCVCVCDVCVCDVCVWLCDFIPCLVSLTLPTHTTCKAPVQLAFTLGLIMRIYEN